MAKGIKKLTDGEKAILRILVEEGSQTREELLELGPNKAVVKRIAALEKRSYIRTAHRSGFHGHEFELGVNGFLWAQGRDPVNPSPSLTHVSRRRKS